MRKKEDKRRIGILTSGGDAPGMNAAIRAVVRTAAQYEDIKVLGIRRGYRGLLDGKYSELKVADVSDIIHRGGTILHTARCLEMTKPEGINRAIMMCKDFLKLDALVVIGGDGSLTGAQELSKHGINVIGIPGTIDLDLACSEYTVGFDTAVNTVMEAIGKLRDTSGSHERCSVVEVMGRSAGDIALWCAITGGAEEVMIPELTEVDTNAVIRQILHNRSKGKTHHLILVAEGVKFDDKAVAGGLENYGSFEFSKELQNAVNIEARATILGHLQRGGNPTAMDRFHASMMGYLAVEIFNSGEKNRIVVVKDGKHTHMDINEGLASEKNNEKYEKMYDIMKILSI